MDTMKKLMGLKQAVLKGPFLVLAVSLILLLFLSLHYEWIVAKFLWDFHEAVLVDYTAGRDVDLEAFQDAIRFFSKIPGIDIKINYQYPGIVPDAGTTKDIEGLENWCRCNCKNLRWNIFNGEVYVDPV